MSGCKTGVGEDALQKVDQLETCIEQTCSFVNGGPADTVQLGGKATPTLRNLTEQVKRAIEQFKAEMRSYMDPVFLNSYAFNVRRTSCVEANVPSGSIITLPVWYFPTRDILFWSVDGMVCTPRLGTNPDPGERQYDEIGDSPNELSNQVRIWFPLEAGMTVDVWVVASNLMKEMARLEAAADRACDCADESCACAEEAGKSAAKAKAEADRAKAEADRAAERNDSSELGSFAVNVRKAVPAATAVAVGGILTLPVSYYPMRNILYLSVDGMVCSPRLKGEALNTALYQYEEVGTDPDVLSNKVKVWFAVEAGMTVDAWVVASNLYKELGTIEAMADVSTQKAGEAAQSAAQAADSAAASAASAVTAAGKVTEAAGKVTEAGGKADAAAQSANAAAQSAADAAQSAVLAAQTVIDAAHLAVGDITPGGIGAVALTDPRLTDARTPKTHAATHKTGGGDALTAADIGAAPAAHTSLAATSAAVGHVKVGAGLSADAAGTVSVSYGTAANTACQGNDSRLSNARTPAAHAATHKTGGADALTAADIGAVSKAGDMVNGNLYVSGVVQSANNIGFRHKSGNISTMWYQDDTNLYLLMTDPGNPDGGFNTLRPFLVRLADGMVWMTGSISGNAATASKLAFPRTISLTGDVTGWASFDGSANVSIAASLAAGAWAKPQAAAGVGQWVATTGTLPSGGTWAYCINTYSLREDGGGIASAGASVGVAAGGTKVAQPSNYWDIRGFAWRIA